MPIDVCRKQVDWFFLAGSLYKSKDKSPRPVKREVEQMIHECNEFGYGRILFRFEATYGMRRRLESIYGRSQTLPRYDLYHELFCRVGDNATLYIIFSPEGFIQLSVESYRFERDAEAISLLHEILSKIEETSIQTELERWR